MTGKAKSTGRTKKAASRTPRKRSTVGASIIKGLEQAIAWSRGENNNVRVTLVHVKCGRTRGSDEDGTQPGAVRDQVRLPAGHVAELGTGPVAPGCTNAGVARCDREAPEAVEDVLRKAS